MSSWRSQVGGWPQAIHAAIQALAVLMAQELRLTRLLLSFPLSNTAYGHKAKHLLHNQASQMHQQSSQQFLWYPVSSENYGSVMPGAWIPAKFILLPLGKDARGQERAMKTGKPHRKVRCPLMQGKSRDIPKKTKAKNIKKRAEVLTHCRHTGAAEMHLQVVLTCTDWKTGTCAGRAEEEILFPTSP